MPVLSALRPLAVGTLLGPEKRREIDWYLQIGHTEKLLGQLTPHLQKVAQIILHFAISVCDSSFCLLYWFMFLFVFQYLKSGRTC